MDLNLAGKTAIVTGGGSNIGRAICLLFAEEKTNLVIAEMDEAQGKKTADEALRLGAECLFVKTDITNNQQVEEMVKQATEKFQQVDILVNNVGWDIDQLYMEETREKWEKIIAINYWGVINCTRAVLDQMVERKQGTIINIGCFPER